MAEQMYVLQREKPGLPGGPRLLHIDEKGRRLWGRCLKPTEFSKADLVRLAPRLEFGVCVVVAIPAEQIGIRPRDEKNHIRTWGVIGGGFGDNTGHTPLLTLIGDEYTPNGGRGELLAAHVDAS